MCPYSGATSCHRARSAKCRPASRPVPVWPGWQYINWSCVTNMTALPAFRCVERNDVVSFPDACYARPHINDYTGAFMAQNGREQTFRIGAGKREVVGVTDAGGFHLDKDFAGFRPVEIHVQDRQWLAFFECNGGARFHSDFLAMELVT